MVHVGMRPYPFHPSVYTQPHTITSHRDCIANLVYFYIKPPSRLNVTTLRMAPPSRPIPIYNTGYEKLFTTPKASRPRLEYQSIQKDTTGEWSCRSLVCQRPDHISFHVQSNESVCWSGLCEKNAHTLRTFLS